MAELGLGSALHCPQGDNYALALAYFQTGLPDGGWDLLQGNLYHDMFNYMSPGALGSRASSALFPAVRLLNRSGLRRQWRS